MLKNYFQHMVEMPNHPHARFRSSAWMAAIPLSAVLAAVILTLVASASPVRVAAPATRLRHVSRCRRRRSGHPQGSNGSGWNPGRTVCPSPGATSAPDMPVIVPAAPAVVPVAAAVAAPITPSVAALVADVEASGIEPGSNWTWTMGDTSTYCGPISGAGTGCTYGEGGLEHTVFAGAPTLTLVAHELANAETQNDAIPSLLHQVATAAAGTSWSPTDAVASCLVEHFMGFQDNAAGSWQCPAALAATAAEHIHDTY